MNVAMLTQTKPSPPQGRNLEHDRGEGDHHDEKRKEVAALDAAGDIAHTVRGTPTNLPRRPR